MTAHVTTCTHLFVDGPNIDAVLGKNVLERKPGACERPRWDRVNEVVGAAKSCFVLNGAKFTPDVTPFYRALKLMGYEAAVAGTKGSLPGTGVDPVDEFIKDRLSAITGEEDVAVAIATHDHGYAPALKAILEAGGSVTIIGFLEFLAPALMELRKHGAVLLDLEHDIGAFACSLDRPSVILE